MKHLFTNPNQIKPLSIKLLKTTAKIQLCSVFILLFLGCGNASKEKQSTVSGENKSTASTNNCMEDFYGKPEALLTKDLLAKFVDFEGAEAEVGKVGSGVGGPDYAQANGQWKIDRQRYIVRLTGIRKIKLYESKTSVDRFYDKYHTATPEERVAKQKLFDSLVLTDENFKNKTEKAQTKMLSKAIGTSFGYLKVDGIGDAAVWEVKLNDLKVLVGDYEFTVNVDLNKGNDYNLEKAKLIAQAIIEKACN